MDEQQDLNQLKEVFISDGMMEAEIVKGKLESRDIHCMLKFEAVGRVLGLTMDGLGKVQVMVQPEDYDRAKEIIAEESAEEGESLT